MRGYWANSNFKIKPHAARVERNCAIVLERARHNSHFMAGRGGWLGTIVESHQVRTRDRTNPFAHAIRPDWHWMRRQGGREGAKTPTHIFQTNDQSTLEKAKRGQGWAILMESVPLHHKQSTAFCKE